MFPVVFHIGALTLEAHFVFELLAYSCGFQYYLYLRRKQAGVSNDPNTVWVVIGGILGAAIGSKLLGFLEHPELQNLAQENIAYAFASKTIAGGLVGGLIGVEIAKKRVGINISTGDMFCFPIILGIIIGRLGCFLAGTNDGTWGNETQSILGIDGGDGTLRHPMPLYEIFILVGIWIGLTLLKNKQFLKEGELFQIFMVGYFSWRLCAEFFKSVSKIEPVGLSAIQIVSILVLVYYHKAIFRLINFMRG